MRRQILQDIPMFVLAPNWRFFVGSENWIGWTHNKWPSDILTTKTEQNKKKFSPQNRTVWTKKKTLTTKSDRLNASFQFSKPRIESLKLDRVNGPLECLPNRLLHELEDSADFSRILVLICFFSDNLPWGPRFQVGAYETFEKGYAQSFGNEKLRLQSLLVSEFSCCLRKTEGKKRIRPKIWR